MPNLAMQAHRDAMDGTLQDALQQAGLSADRLDAVAVTIGPGLSLCLKVSSHANHHCNLWTHFNQPSLFMLTTTDKLSCNEHSSSCQFHEHTSPLA